ncbi:TPR repeat family protein, partial [Vibrio parahaemolyticus V-223/04]
LRKTSQDKR